MSAATFRAKHAARWLYRDRGNDFDPVAFKWFRENGIDPAMVTNLTGPAVRLSLTIDDDGYIVADELGDQCLAFVVTGEDDETELDIVAFCIQDPERFGTFLNQAGLCGTSAVLNPASFYSGPCPLWSTPLRWLQAGCQGGCVLDADLARPVLSKAPGKLLVESLDNARALVAAGVVSANKLTIRNSNIRRAA